MSLTPVPLQRYSCQLERLTVKIHDRYSTVSLDIRLKTYQSNGARSASYRDWRAALDWVGFAHQLGEIPFQGPFLVSLLSSATVRHSCQV